jgi:acyl dehydratase
LAVDDQFASKSIFFEDFAPGDVHDLGSYVMEIDEMVAFARQFDPHPLHIDEEAGRKSFFQGLVASGVHTLGVYSRLMYDGLMRHVAMAAGRGLDRVRLRAPVRPGDVLSGRALVTSVGDARRPEHGLVTLECELRSQNDIVVLSLSTQLQVYRRAATGLT